MSETFEPAVWRLVTSPAGAGAWNMAVDEAILEAVAARKSPPTLRLYAWDPPCLSLGFAQPSTDVDQAALQSRGWEVVRRPTGGRAILHTDELTYSVCVPQDEPRVHGGIIESYRRLSRALLMAIEMLGLAAQADRTYALPEGAVPNAPVCFEVPSSYEITVDGRKLVGSAQARKHECVLQHGSLPLWGDLTRITQVLNFTDEAQRARAAQRLIEHAANAEMLGRRFTWHECADAVRRGFEETLQLVLIDAPLTADEQARAQALADDKYAHADWTYKA